MLAPSIFGEKLFDEWMDEPFENMFFHWPQEWSHMMKSLEKDQNMEKALYGKHAKNMMKTDVKETDQDYEVDIDLPGFKKDEINVSLQDGYLTIAANKGLNKEEKKQKDGTFIRRERYVGSLSRSFYVGDTVKQEDIKAKYESGILRLTVPKNEIKTIEQSNHIAIEG